MNPDYIKPLRIQQKEKKNLNSLKCKKDLYATPKIQSWQRSTKWDAKHYQSEEYKWKPQWDITSHLSKWLKWKRLTVPSVGEDVKKQEPTCTASGDIEWYTLSKTV